MRRLLLFLSRQKGLRRWMETSRLARGFSSRFVAGETLAAAMAVSRRVNSEGISVTLDHLGENVTSLEEAASSRDVYLESLSQLSQNGIQGNVSLKLSQFGIDLSEDACRANVEQLVRRAAEIGSFVRVDMENSDYTDRTLQLVADLHARFGPVGAVIQAYLHRSAADIATLCRKGIRVRLCKGAYLEPPERAFSQKADVDRNFVTLMQTLLTTGIYPAIATHDRRMIAETERFARERQIAPERFEFQMLYGIRRDLQRRLVAEGFRLRLYVWNE